MKFLSTHFSSQLSSLFNVLASSALTLPPVLGHQWTWRGSIPLHCPALKKTLNNTRPCSEPWGAPPVTSHYCNSDLCPVNFPLILLLSPLVSSSAPRILQEAAKSLLEVQVNNTHCSLVPAEMVMALWHCPFQCPLASLPIVLSPGSVTETTWKDSNVIDLLVQQIQPWGLDWIPMPRDSSKVNFVLKYCCKIIITIEKGLMY